MKVCKYNKKTSGKATHSELYLKKNVQAVNKNKETAGYDVY